MVDFSVQFNLIAFVVVAAIAGIYFFGNVILFARMHRHGASFSSVLFFIFGWIFLLASFAVSLLALTARFKLFGISVSAAGNNLIISGIGNGFEIPFIGGFMQSIFDALMMECFVYGVFVLTLICVILCPVKWKKRGDVLEPVKRHGDGDGYVTVESGAFSGQKQTSEEEPVTVAPVIVTEPETEDKTTEVFAEIKDDSVEPDNTDISVEPEEVSVEPEEVSVEPEEVSVETEKEESDGDLIFDTEEENSEVENGKEPVFEPQTEEEAESEAEQKSEKAESEERDIVVAEEELPIENEPQLEEQSEEKTTEPTEKTETVETEKEEIILKPETASEDTIKPEKPQTEDVQTEAEEESLPQEEEKAQKRVYEYEGMEFNPQRIIKRERKVVRPGERPEVKQPAPKKTVGGRRRVITSRASEIFDEYMDAKEEDERKRIEAAIDKVTVSNEDK